MLRLTWLSVIAKFVPKSKVGGGGGGGGGEEGGNKQYNGECINCTHYQKVYQLFLQLLVAVLLFLPGWDANP